MNPVIEAIKKRRSVRSYTSEAVPRDVIEAIIDAGNWSPTGHNQQRWRFVVVEDKAFRRKLIEAARPVWKRVVGGMVDIKDDQHRQYIIGLGSRCLGWHSLLYEETVARLAEMDDGMYWAAPVVIFVIGTAAEECAMVCQSMVLAAYSLGLGSCIVGFGAQVTDDAEIVEALELKENERIYGPIVLGYSGLYPEPPKKKEPVIKWIT